MIKHIYIENFGRIKKIDVDCYKKNVFLVGPNGTGKTTFLQAISLALTGKVAKDLKNDMFIGEYSNDFTVKLTLDDGSVILRTSKGCKLKTTDGKLYLKVKDVQDHLTFDPLTLYNLAYVRQGEIADLFVGSTGKAVIDKLVGLVLNSKRLVEGYTEVTRRLNSTISDLENEKIMKESAESSINANADEVQSKLDIITKRINDLGSSKYSDSQISTFENMYNKYDSYKLSLNRLREEYKNAVTKFNNTPKAEKPEELEKQYRNTEKRKLLQSNVDESIKERDKWINLKSFEKEIEEYCKLDTRLLRSKFSEEALKDITDNNNKVFTMLTTESFTDSKSAKSKLDMVVQNYGIDTETILKTKEKMNEINSKIDIRDDTIQIIRGSYMNGNSVEDTIDDYIKKLDAVADDYKRSLKQYEGPDVTYQDYKSALDVYNYYVTARHDVETIKSRGTQVHNDMVELASSIKQGPSREELKDLSNRSNTLIQLNENKRSYTQLLDSIRKTENRIKESEKKISVLQDKIKVLRFWKDILNGAPNKLRQALFGPVVAYLNQQFYQVFSFNGLGEITIDWEKVTLTIGDKSFEQCSGAQMIAIGLSMRLALLQILGSCIPMMLIDEPTVFLDDDRKNDVKKLLLSISEITQLFVCTHDDSIITDNNTIVLNILDQGR